MAKKEETFNVNADIVDVLLLKKFITPSLIRASYLIGVLAIVLTAIFSVFIEFSLLSVASGIIILIIGNIVWRVMCEGAIILFNMHDYLRDIKR